MSLISAERLHRWKCVYCGSKDKNIVNILAPLAEGEENLVGSTGEVNGNKLGSAMKIVTCSQCGHTDIFSHSALMAGHILRNEKIPTFTESENYVKKFHDKNHNDPLRNPHNEHPSTTTPKNTI
jgi:predicted nucleic-acid-binding Zn-ribbon protein